MMTAVITVFALLGAGLVTGACIDVLLRLEDNGEW
jgi:hypothetical protein